jgi:hypothetical protein
MARTRLGDSIAAILAVVGFLLIGDDFLLVGLILLGIVGVWIYKTQKVQLLALFIGAVGLALFLVLGGIGGADTNIIGVFFPIIFVWDSFTIYRIEKRVKKVMKNLKMKDFQVEVIPYKISSYYLETYDLKSPYLVRVVCTEDVVKGFYDMKTNTWVTVESESFPIYTSVPEKVWKIVVSTHPNGSIHKTEYRDKYESLVGVDIFDEVGTKSNVSWRLHRDMYETWDFSTNEWKPRSRGWYPPTSIMGRIAASLGLM